MASKAAAVNFHKILSSGIGKETGAQLAAFRKRSEEARRALNQLKAQPVTVDFAAYKGVLKVKQAQESSAKLEAELKDLKETLSNIEGARPFDQLSVADVIAARPEIGKTVDEMVKKGKWTVPGYHEKFGNLAVM